MWDRVFDAYQIVLVQNLLRAVGTLPEGAWRQPCIDGMIAFRNHIYTEIRVVGHPAGEAYMYDCIRQNWTFTRTQISLQLRLLVEQIFYDLGQPWRKLVTGFRPVD